MSTKQNMYVGIKKEAEKILDEINESIVVYSLDDDGFKEIIGYCVTTAKEIRDDVANMQGKLQILIKGLDKDSKKREHYEKVLRQCTHFLEITKR